MKKVLNIVLIGALIFVLTACGNKGNDTGDQNDNNTNGSNSNSNDNNKPLGNLCVNTGKKGDYYNVPSKHKSLADAIWDVSGLIHQEIRNEFDSSINDIEWWIHVNIGCNQVSEWEFTISKAHTEYGQSYPDSLSAGASFKMNNAQYEAFLKITSAILKEVYNVNLTVNELQNASNQISENNNCASSITKNNKTIEICNLSIYRENPYLSIKIK